MVTRTTLFCLLFGTICINDVFGGFRKLDEKIMACVGFFFNMIGH